MNEANSEQNSHLDDDLLPEYRFDYAKAKPNRFARKAEQVEVIVKLDPDVAQIFTNQEAVNKALRALIEAMPKATVLG